MKFQLVIEVGSLSELNAIARQLGAQGKGSSVMTVEDIPASPVSPETEAEALKQVEQPSDDTNDPWADEDPAPPPKAVQKPAGKPAGTGEPVRAEDKFGNRWELGRADAPDCLCGLPAGKVHARAKSSGKPYTAWRCAKQLGDDWKSKCSFSEFG